MDEMKPLTEREICLIEEIGVMRRVHEINQLVHLCLCVRLGGDVKIENDELDYTRKNYTLNEEVSVEDLTRSIRLRARLK